MAFLVPDNEVERLTALRELAVLDTEPEAPYDDVVRLASAIFRTPIASVNLIDADRQWAKAHTGSERFDAPREDSLCAHTIMADDGVLVVGDARRDPRFAATAQVLGPPRLRFYAGAAIVTAAGLALGSVCVADRVPRELDPEGLEALRILARQAAGVLELRGASQRLLVADERVKRLTIEDGLTGLANRGLLVTRLEQALREARRTGAGLGVLVGDLDGFGAVNEGLGHAAADHLLRVVAERLRGTARAGDTVARLVGDQFAVICPGVRSLATLDISAGRLRAAVAAPVELAGVRITPALTFGVALAGPGDDVAALLRRADADMGETKRGAPVLS